MPIEQRLLNKLTSNSPNISVIDFDELGVNINDINDVGNSIIQLLDALKSNTYVTTLNLALCNLTDVSIVKIADYLHNNENITSIDVSNNAITDVGAIAIANALVKNRHLKQLNISYNRITEQGAEVLNKAVCKSASMIKFIADHDNEGTKTVCNRNLQKLKQAYPQRPCQLNCTVM